MKNNLLPSPVHRKPTNEKIKVESQRFLKTKESVTPTRFESKISKDNNDFFLHTI